MTISSKNLNRRNVSHRFKRISFICLLVCPWIALLCFYISFTSEVNKEKRRWKAASEEVHYQEGTTLNRLKAWSDEELRNYCYNNTQRVQQFKDGYRTEVETVKRIEEEVAFRQSIKDGTIPRMWTRLGLYILNPSGFTAVNHGTLQGFTLKENKVILHFYNQHSKCKPRIRITFYNQFAEPLDNITESWSWYSLRQGERYVSNKYISTLGQPVYYFSYSYSERR